MVGEYLDIDGLTHYDSKIKEHIASLMPVCKTTEDWAKETGKTYKKGQICIWSDYKKIIDGQEEKNVAGIKIADGSAYILDIPFIDFPLWEKISSVEDTITNHIKDTVIHTNAVEKSNWNDKVSATVNSATETIVFSK